MLVNRVLQGVICECRAAPAALLLAAGECGNTEQQERQQPSQIHLRRTRHADDTSTSIMTAPRRISAIVVTKTRM